MAGLKRRLVHTPLQQRLNVRACLLQGSDVYDPYAELGFQRRGRHISSHVIWVNLATKRRVAVRIARMRSKSSRRKLPQSFNERPKRRPSFFSRRRMKRNAFVARRKRLVRWPSLRENFVYDLICALCLSVGPVVLYIRCL